MSRVLIVEDYAAMLLDIMLPGKTGFEVCRELRKSRKLPIIMVTAKKKDVDKIRGLGLGVDDYLVKPFSPAELILEPKPCLHDLGDRSVGSSWLRRGIWLSFRKSLSSCYWRVMWILYIDKGRTVVLF